MATVADIGVNVWANSAQFTSEIEKVRTQGKQTFSGLVGDVEGFAHKMHESLGVIRQFKPLLELGFGVEIGRQAFEQLHEGLTKGLGEFEAAQRAGMSFGDSLLSGVEKALHLKTALEDLIERQKALKEGADAFMKGTEVARKFEEKEANGGQEPHRWEHLNDPSRADQAWNAIHDSIKAARDAAQPFHQAISDARQELEKLDHVGNPDLLRAIQQRQEAQNKLNKALEDGKKLFDNEEAAPMALAQFESLS